MGAGQGASAPVPGCPAMVRQLPKRDAAAADALSQKRLTKKTYKYYKNHKTLRYITQKKTRDKGQKAKG